MSDGQTPYLLNQQLQKWGNSHAIRLPRSVLLLAGVSAADAFDVEIGPKVISLRFKPGAGVLPITQVRKSQKTAETKPRSKSSKSK